MTTNDTRAAFEQWAIMSGLNVARHRDAHTDYDSDDTQWAWLGVQWREALIVDERNAMIEVIRGMDSILQRVYDNPITASWGRIQDYNELKATRAIAKPYLSPTAPTGQNKKGK